ncbi:N-methyl-L-tryptophan oxidase [bacterium]|nr:MAG: N-methyl-L-tryptophan oxidase [bacterium]
MRILIIGAGIVGAMTAWRLAKAGHEVEVFEQYGLDHDRGSSYGDSRVVRRVYADPFYTALMADAYPLWEDLQEQVGQELFAKVGGIFFGPADHPDIREAENALAVSGVEYERLDAPECARRFSAFRMREGEVALFEPSMGYVRASRCVRAAVDLATKLGARFHFESAIHSVRAFGAGVGVVTESGEAFGGDRLLICAGPWTGPLLANLGIVSPLQVVRKTYLHLEPQRNAADFEVGRFPVWIDADSLAYGFPRLGEVPGVKIAFHGGGEVVTADEVKRGMGEEERLEFLDYAAQRFPDLSARVSYEKVCLYTNTPDEDFIVDRVPGLDNAFVMGGTSGHGFKFGPLLGEIGMGLLTGGTVLYDLSRFSIDRFKKGVLIR